MEFKTTKQLFDAIKDDFIKELSQYTYPNDHEQIIDLVQSCLESIFGEEYKSHLTESETHLFNKFISALGIDISHFCPPAETESPVSDKAANKVSIGAISGFITGVVISSIILKPSTSLAAGLIIAISTCAGGAVAPFLKKKLTSNKMSTSINNSLYIQKIIVGIENLCDKVDGFMNVCRVQLSR